MSGACLQGKNALVTGGTRGIGLAIARGFRGAGAVVWIHGRDLADADMLAEFGGKYLGADLADAGAAMVVARDLAGMTDRLDILVNNAGVETIMPIDQLDPAVLEQTCKNAGQVAPRRGEDLCRDAATWHIVGGGDHRCPRYLPIGAVPVVRNRRRPACL